MPPVSFLPSFAHDTLHTMADFTSTLKRGDQSGELSLTLGAARSAAQEFSTTMKDKERKRAKAKRRKLKERRLLEAAAKAAADAGLDFTGTMKKRAMDVLAQHRGGADDNVEEYADDGFEADDGDADYESDFEDERLVHAAVLPAAIPAASSVGPSSSSPRKHHRRNTSSSTAASLMAQHQRSGSGDAAAPVAAGAGGGGGMESIRVGADAAFEATLGGKRGAGGGGGGKKKRQQQGGGKREKDAFSETYTRSGLPGKRVDVDSDDDGSPLGVGGSQHHRTHSLTDEQLPALPGGRAPSSGAPTGRGHSPRSSPGTSNYLSDASASQLPTIGARRR